MRARDPGRDGRDGEGKRDPHNDWRAWTGFTAMAVGMFMAILDIQIVASSLPDIQAALSLPTARLSWIQTVYLITEIIAIPLTGFLTRALSTRVLFVGAILGFVASSLLCAAATGFWSLIIGRALQGFCGGAIIPIVFAAAFRMITRARQAHATALAGMLAMLAPTLGPALGGYITETYSWHYLFLINLPPGLAVAALVVLLVDLDRPDWRLLRRIDVPALLLLAVFLASLEIALKQGPERGWDDGWTIGLSLLCLASGVGVALRCLVALEPLVELRSFADRCFTIGCLYSFTLGMGLYGSVYVMPLFLGLVRQHSALEIGEIMMVTGVAQLLVAPVAAWLETHTAPRPLTFVGYALFAAGLAANGFMTFDTDFAGLFWPQLLRGAAIMLCLLPTTQLALGSLPLPLVANASGLFNMMRNLGGAIGLALIDTVIERRAPAHAAALAAQLQAGSREAAALVGLSLDRFHGVPIGPVDQATRDMVAPLIERAGLVAAFNDCWLALGAILALSLLFLPLMRAPKAAVRRTKPE
jgi:DHA2 family multidrug resistance protein